MSIATEISRLQTDRNTIRAKLVELGMATNTDNLDKLAAAIESLINRGAVSVTVKEGETYTIPAGYHNGSGTVSGVAGGGSYSLQSKAATPTKLQQNITPDSGYYGLSDVTVAPIPEAFQDVTSVTAAAGDVLTGKVYVTSGGAVTAGTMVNNGAVNKTLDVTTITYTIPKGYHSGTGTVKITLEEKAVTPTKSAQTITPTSGKVLSKVTVAAIPAAYQDVTSVTAGAGDVLSGKKIVDATGNVVDGTIPVEVEGYFVTLDTETTCYFTENTYHTGTEVAIYPETKTVTPTKVAQDVTPSRGKVLSKVTVNPIPANYADFSGTDVTTQHVLDGIYFIDKDGNADFGTMPNNSGFDAFVDGLTTTSVTIPKGYHDGSGAVSLGGEIEAALAAI